MYSRNIKIPAIAASGIKQYTESSKELKAGVRKYGYYNSISIANGGKMDVRLEVGFGKTFPIPANAILTVPGLRYDTFNVVNINDTYPTIVDEIEVTVTVEDI